MSVPSTPSAPPNPSTSSARASSPQPAGPLGTAQRLARGAEPSIGFHQILSAKLGHELFAPGLTAKTSALTSAHQTPPPLGIPQQHVPHEGAPRPAHGRRQAGDERDGDEAPKRAPVRELDALDPALRQSAQLAPPVTTPAVASTSAAATEPVRGRMSMEELLPVLVKRIAWAGDKHSGSVRLELGAGAYAGTTLLVHSDAGRVRVEVTGQEGADLDRLRRRLDERLRNHGLNVEAVT